MPDKPTPEEMFKKEEKIEIDPCIDLSIDMIIKSAALKGIGDCRRIGRFKICRYISKCI